MNRLVSIDIAKAICIILVVVGHYHPENSPEWYNVLNHLIYSFHMPLFMFASGYVYIATQKSETYGVFILKKMKRLLIPYFSTSIIVISIKLGSQHGMLVDNPVTWYSYFKLFYLPEAGFFLWFIWALWGMFLIVPLVKTTQGRTILFIVSLFIVFLPFQWTDIFCIKQTMAMLKYFMFGVFLYEHNYLIDKAKKVSLLIPIVLFFVLFFFREFIKIDIISTVINLLLPFIGIYFICMIAIEINKKYKKATNVFLSISASSYIIYLFHTTFEGFVKSVIYKFPLLVDANNLIGFGFGALLVITSGIVFPILLHRFILKRNSVLQILFGLKNWKLTPRYRKLL